MQQNMQHEKLLLDSAEFKEGFPIELQNVKASAIQAALQLVAKLVKIDAIIGVAQSLTNVDEEDTDSDW